MDVIGVPDVSIPLKSTLDLFIGFGADFFAFIVVAALIAAFAFYFGSDRLMPLTAGLYAGIPLYTYFPYTTMLGDNAYFSIALYAVLAVLATVAFSGLSYFMASGGAGFLKTGGLSIIIAGFILAVAVHLLPTQSVYTFSEPTRALFNLKFLFWWLVAPLAGLFILGR